MTAVQNLQGTGCGVTHSTGFLFLVSLLYMGGCFARTCISIFIWDLMFEPCHLNLCYLSLSTIFPSFYYTLLVELFCFRVLVTWN